MKSIHEIKADILVIHYKGQRVEVDISKELMITEPLINTQLKHSPSNQAFLCLIRDRLIYRRDKLEKLRDQAYSKAWLFYKEGGNINNDQADHKASIHPKFISICERFNKLNYQVNKLISICRAYEAREKIMQTVSANIRKQS